jgi:hypothetical protein
MLAGVEEVEGFETVGQLVGQKRPVVVNTVGELDQLQRRGLT